MKECKLGSYKAMQKKHVWYFLFKEFLSFFTRLVPCGIFQFNCCLLILDGHGSHVILHAIDQAHHVILVSWVDKALDQSKKNIKHGFKVIRIYPPNPKTMDERTKPSDLYTLAPNTTCISKNDDDN